MKSSAQHAEQLKNPMRFSFLAAGTEETASSRIRVYTLKRVLTAMGMQVRLGHWPGADVLLIQKRVTREILQLAQEAKERECTILYDVDDLGGALWHWVDHALFDEMVRLADVVVTDTIGRCDILMSDYGVIRVEVVPDAIDYYPVAPVMLSLTESSPLRVLWFGGLHNFILFEKYAGRLTTLPDLEVLVTTCSSGVERHSNKYPSIKFVPWSRSGFISLLQSCQLACLMHDGLMEEDRTKSNNRMITSITWGVPAVISRTPEYERTALEAGVDYALFGDEFELQSVIERLRSSESRAAYLATAQPIVWNHYSPERVTQRFLRVVAKYSQ